MSTGIFFLIFLNFKSPLKTPWVDGLVYFQVERIQGPLHRPWEHLGPRSWSSRYSERGMNREEVLSLGRTTPWSYALPVSITGELEQGPLKPRARANFKGKLFKEQIWLQNARSQ